MPETGIAGATALVTGASRGFGPGRAGQAITDLVVGPGPDQDAYLLTAAGPCPLA